MPNAGLSRECEPLSQHKLPAAKSLVSALPWFLLFPGSSGRPTQISENGKFWFFFPGHQVQLRFKEAIPNLWAKQPGSNRLGN